MGRMPIGELLIEAQLVNELQRESAVAYQQRWGGRIGQAFVRLGFLQEATLLSAIGQQLGVPFVEIGDRSIPPHVLTLVPEKLMRARKVCPLSLLSEKKKRGPLVVALSQPENLNILDEIAFATGFSISPVLAAESDIDRALARHLDGEVDRPDLPSIPAPEDGPQSEPVIDTEALRAQAAQARRRRFH